MLVSTLADQPWPRVARQRVGQPARMRVLGQSDAVVFHGVQCPGGDDARLSHGPAELLAEPPRPFDPVARPRQRRAHRRPEALREAHIHGVERRRVIAFRYAARRAGVPQTRPIKMQRQIVSRAATVTSRIRRATTLSLRRGCACSHRPAVWGKWTSPGGARPRRPRR
jgi:hypothetical protein